MPNLPQKKSSRSCDFPCKVEEHADDIISAIRLPTSLVLDRQVASYISSICSRFDTVYDKLRRTALHASASHGRKDLCRWLINYGNARINAQDSSSCTPLHECIAGGYIDVAIMLIKMGADLSIKNIDHDTPIDKTVKEMNGLPSKYRIKFSKDDSYCYKEPEQDEELTKMTMNFQELRSYGKWYLTDANTDDKAFYTEVYTWGTNQNYTNGLADGKRKGHPEFLEFFDKRNELIIDICMNRFHTLFISLNGNVWGCGLDQRGRLGFGSDETVLIPRRIIFPGTAPKFCVKAAIGEDHSVFLCKDNEVYTCGLNTYHQLGFYPPPVFVSKLQLVDIDKTMGDFIGVAASSYCSIVWTEKTIFTCGLNAGQIGHEPTQGKTIPQFRKVHNIIFTSTPIHSVFVGERATVIMTKICTLFLLQDYLCRKIEFGVVANYVKQFDNRESSGRKKLRSGVTHEKKWPQVISKICVTGGSLDSEKIKSTRAHETLKIAALLFNGEVYLWTSDYSKFVSCVFKSKHRVKVKDLIFLPKTMMITTQNGDACFTYDENYRMISRNPNASSNEFTEVRHRNSETTSSCEYFSIKIHKMSRVARALKIFSDPKGDNYALLQQRSIVPVICYPKIYHCFIDDMQKFFEELNDFDISHDVEYNVRNVIFRAHKYMVAHHSEELAFLESDNGVIQLENVHPDIFKEVLKYIYTGTCQLLNLGPCAIKIPKTTDKPSSTIKYEDPVRLACKFGYDFKMKYFLHDLTQMKYEDETLKYKNARFIKEPNSLVMNRSKYRNLWDVKLKSQDGQLFHAHKCVLIARMEYYKLMLSGFWMESSNTKDEFYLPVSSAILQEILDYVYTDNIDKPIHVKDFNFWCSLLVAADQFLLPTLKNFAEFAIAKCLDTRNCVDALLLAETLNASQLAYTCIEFISYNIRSLLLSRNLEKLSENTLFKITQFYRIWNENVTFSNFPSNVDDSFDPFNVIDVDDLQEIEWEPYLKWDDVELKKKEPILSVQKKRARNARKTPTKVEVKEIKQEKTPTFTPKKEISIVEPKVIARPEENWIPVDRRMKSVKSSLKVNSAVKNCPELIEQKENFVPLTKSKDVKNEEIENKGSPITINLDFENIGPKLSQKQRRKLKSFSESTSKSEGSSPKSAWNKNNSFDSSSETDCWNIGRSPVMSFSAIMASEQKQKTIVKKETKKIETKTLQMTQIEDKAIQELLSFYNINEVDDENITVERVTYDVEAPQWVVR